MDPVSLGTSALMFAVKEVINVYNKHKELARALEDLKREADQCTALTQQAVNIPSQYHKQYDFSGLVNQLQRVTLEAKESCQLLLDKKKKFPNNVLSIQLGKFIQRVSDFNEELHTISEWLHKMVNMGIASHVMREEKKEEKKSPSEGWPSMQTEEEILQHALEILLQTRITLKKKLENVEETKEEPSQFTKMVNTMRETQLNSDVALFWLNHFPNKISVSWGEFVTALKEHHAKNQSGPELSKQNLRILQEALDPECTGNISIYELKILERNLPLEESLSKVIKHKWGVGKVVEVRGWVEENGWQLEKSWMRATILDATPRKVCLQQSTGTKLHYWRKRDEIRPLGGIQKGVPLEIFDQGGWFSTEIINVIDDETVYLDDVGESGYSIADPVPIGNLQYRLLGRTHNFKKQKHPAVGDLIQVQQLNNSYAKKYINVQAGLPQWFDAIVEAVLNEGNRLEVRYLEEIPVDEDVAPVEEDYDDMFGSLESNATERASKVDLEKCRPFRCIGVSDPVEVELGAGEETRWHAGIVVAHKGTEYEVNLHYEGKDFWAPADKIRPVPFVRCNAWNYAPESFTAVGGRTADL